MARLFIVEDDASLRENLVRMLKLKGHECLCCGSFANAAGEALAACPDCVLLDLSLPGAYGHEVCRSIRQESNVPIIVLTSSDSEFDEVMSMNVGADDYVVKPYRPAALLARIDRALARSGSADSARRQLERDGVLLDPVRAEVSYRGKTVELSRNELLDLAHPHGECGLHHLAQRANGRAVANRRVRRRQHAHGEREPPAPQLAVRRHPR